MEHKHFSTFLRNRTYIGEGHFGASYAVVPEKPLKRGICKKVKKTSRRMRPESEWIIIPTPAIVDKDLFMRAQKRLKENFVTARRNRKNEYLLSGKIRCACGRTGQAKALSTGSISITGALSRVLDYPLPPTCTERGINARIADSLVWERIVELMSSKALMLKQVERWAAERRNVAHGGEADVITLREELTRLKKQEDRFTKAYAEGIVLLFIEKTEVALRNLNFEQKRAIVINVIDKVVASREIVEVYGYIPITDHVELCSTYRDGVNAIRYHFGRRFIKSIPFDLVIPLPPPLKRGIDYGFLPGTKTSSKGKH